MNTDLWYQLRSAATRYDQDPEKHRAQLVGAVRRARAAGASWGDVGKAAGVPWQRLRVMVGEAPTPVAGKRAA